MSQGYRRKRKSHRKLVYLFLVEIIIILVLLFVLFIPSKVHRKVSVEAGAKLTNVELFLKDNQKGKFVTDMTKIDANNIGKTTILIMVDGKEYKSILTIRDTIAPKAEDAKATGAIGTKLKAIDCVKNIKDATKVSATFKKEPNWKSSKKQSVEVILQDEGNNKTKINVQLTLVEDKEAPVITGVKDQVINLNGTISYKKGVIVTDNQDKKPELIIDNSKVDLGKEGTYTVIYTAKDQGKNQTKIEAKITVMSQSNFENKDEMDTLVTETLAQIIKPNMTKLQMAKAIYTWTNRNINYTDASDKSSWISGAIQGLKTRSGDCFQYFAVAKALLTQVGIDNVDVVKSDTSESSHFWSLVNLGEGYYHFDTTPRKGEGDYFFMLTDAQLEAYSKTHENSHVFDSALYPKRATTPIVE